MRFTKPQLSQAKLSGLEKQHAKPTLAFLGRNAGNNKDGDDAVNCQCGWQKEDDGMVSWHLIAPNYTDVVDTMLFLPDLAAYTLLRLPRP